ncbi:hypothetical protein BX666DRAFT_1918445 [Dichotomocladium elegans]|nr:hypothetical protein BX666DRAFT_1918445 [Dichotomocladium elegans]
MYLGYLLTSSDAQLRHSISWSATLQILSSRAGCGMYSAFYRYLRVPPNSGGLGVIAPFAHHAALALRRVNPLPYATAEPLRSVSYFHGRYQQPHAMGIRPTAEFFGLISGSFASPECAFCGQIDSHQHFLWDCPILIDAPA